MSLTAANYEEAIGILKRRFGNKQQIISRHMDVLMKTESVSSHTNVKALRHLYDVVESNIRSLKSLGVTADSYGSLLASVIMNKLPNELQLIIGRKIGDDNWNLEFILQELLQEIETRERTAGSTTTDSSSQPKDHQQQLHCLQQHVSDKCQEVRGVDDRRQALKTAGHCFVCLRKGHIFRECRSKKQCFSCGGKHHSSICNRLTEPRSNKSPTT